MRIEDDVKLDYDDVLIRPKRSTLTSRYDVDMNLEYTFYHSKRKWSGVPIMASNMDGVGTMEIADILATEKMFTCLVKTYHTHALVEYFDPDMYGGSNVLDIYDKRVEHVAMCIGATEEEYQKFRDVY